MSDDIAGRRLQIDALDEALVRLLNERAEHARAIGSLKGEGPAYNPEREAEVLKHVASASKGPLSQEHLARIFSEVMSACRSLEQPITVGYLGPQGTFSEMALYKHFGRSVDALSCPSIDEVFRKAETGAAHYAVVPVENSTEGAIGRTLDLLLSTPLRICAEVVLRVRQNLMAREVGYDTRGHIPSCSPESEGCQGSPYKASMEQYTRVYSHPQSLAQCHAWLSQNLPRAERVPLASNAEAARRAAEENDACAIGPDIAAERYGLSILAAGIEDDTRNMTRFLVLGTNETRPTGRDRTSLAMTARNRPGAVHELITPLAQHGVSMTRIESRPARTGQWEYYFYVDIEGHQAEPRVAQALEEVKSKAPFVKVFGSYPAAES